MAASLALQIAKTISDAIANGEIADGEHLSAPKLASRFGVSRSPIREALELLAELGFAEQRANRGFFARAEKAVEGAAASNEREGLMMASGCAPPLTCGWAVSRDRKPLTLW